MINSSTLSLILLLVATGALRWKSGRPFVVKNVPKFFLGSVFIIFTVQIYWSWAQFRAWQAVAPSKYLLPPYNGWGYFLQYVGWKLFAPYIISLIVALIFFYLARWYNRRHGRSFFYEEEHYLIALAFFLSGHPGWIIYSVILITSSLLFLAFRHFIFHKTDKFSLYNFWLPAAAVAILIIEWLRTSFEFISKLGV